MGEGLLQEHPPNTRRLQDWPQTPPTEQGGRLAVGGRALAEAPWRSQPRGRVFFSSLAGSSHPLPSLPPK